MKLSGRQYEQLTNALLEAFPGLARLRQMIRFRLDKNLDEIALGDDLKEIVFKLIQAAEAEGWTLKLISAARESNPSNPKLLALVQQFGMVAIDVSRPGRVATDISSQELEREIRAAIPLLDIEKWHTKLGEIIGQVCCVEITLNGGLYHTYGTGFLLGPDVLITNYHVIDSVIEGEQRRAAGKGYWATPSDVVFRFDYKRLGNQQIVNPGVEYHLATRDWLIDHSPMSPVDHLLEPKNGLPQFDELDYALVRLEGAPGDEPIGQHPEPGALRRGWLDIPMQTYNFQSGTPLLIVQHPQGRPLKLTFDTDAIIGLNENKTRVKYRTNTERGSSGAPCFNINWELVALHHAGDPNFDFGYQPTYNQGIPLTAIVELLKKRDLKNILDESQL